jgi:hypothetical protein
MHNINSEKIDINYKSSDINQNLSKAQTKTGSLLDKMRIYSFVDEENCVNTDKNGNNQTKDTEKIGLFTSFRNITV